MPRQRVGKAQAMTRDDQHGCSVPLTVMRNINWRWPDGKSVRACIDLCVADATRLSAQRVMVGATGIEPVTPTMSR